MKRRRVILATLLIAILGGFAWFVLPAPPEPVYQGKRLTFWLEDLNGTRATQAERAKAEEAIRAIGTNAIPTLLRMLRARDTPLKLRLIALAQKQHVFKIHHTSAQELNMQAAEGIRLLGPAAASAVPQLIRLYDENPHYWSRHMVVVMFGQMGPAARSAVPTLLRGLDDTNAFLRNNAAWALGVIHSQPDVAVPELMKRLSDPEEMVRANAARALGCYGHDARAAVPALTELFEKEQSRPPSPSGSQGRFTLVLSSWLVSYAPPDNPGPPRPVGTWDVIGTTKKALTEIDPEAAAKAGVK
jgi:hypothetical protein